MKIAVDLGNRYVKAISETGARIMFRSVIAEGKRRAIFSFSKTKSNVSDTLQVSFGKSENARHYYVGKMAERFGALPEYVFGKERFDSESAERLVYTALALLNQSDEPVDLVLDYPYSQFETMKNTFTNRLIGQTQTVDVGSGRRQITIQSVAEFPQALAAAYALAASYREVFSTEDGYIAVVDIGGDTTDVVVLELLGDDLIIHEELSGTLTHGTRDLTQTIRRSFETATGDIPDPDLADRVIELGSVFYANQTWNFAEDVKRTKQNLATLLKSQVADLWGARKNRIRALFWVGGGAQMLTTELTGFHRSEEFPTEAQWKNAEGCLIAATAPVEPANVNPEINDNTHSVDDFTHDHKAQTQSNTTDTTEAGHAGVQPSTDASLSEPEKRVESTVPRPELTSSTQTQPSSQVPRRFREGRGGIW